MLQYIDQALKAVPSAPAEAVVLSNVSRRTFLAGSAAGFAVAAFAGKAEAFARYKTGGDAMPHGLVSDPLVFVEIAPDGTVTIVAHRSEMGTGARTSLPMVLAEEMNADWSRVTLRQAEGDEPKYGNQDTDGSRSLRHHIQTMRQMGASVRHMLARAAAEEWGVQEGDVTVGIHEVTHDGKTLGFGDLAKQAMGQPVPAFEELTFTDESEFRYIGKGKVSIYDLHDITTGKAVYGCRRHAAGHEVRRDRPAARGRRRAAALRRQQGPGHAGRRAGHSSLPVSIMPAKFAPLGGIAVIASNTDTAIKGRDALEIEWGDSPHSGYNTAAYKAEMSETAKKPGTVFREEGDRRRGLLRGGQDLRPGVLPAAHGARDHGAALWRSPTWPAASARSGPRSRAPTPRAPTSPRRSAWTRRT